MSADPETARLALLVAAAFASAVLSGMVGMAGGMALLAVMLLFLEPVVAIPLHGAIQLVSNLSRTAVQRRHVRWGILLRYGLLLAPAGWLGLGVVRELPPAALRAAIGTLVLAATWAPGRLRLGAASGPASGGRHFVWLGGVAGFLNVTIGAIGPLVAPFFLGLGLSRQAVVGTQAACQALGHAVKIALFGATGFAFGAHLPLLVLGSLAVAAGTAVGSRLLERLSERHFTVLYKSVLTLLALRLIADVVWGGA